MYIITVLFWFSKLNSQNEHMGKLYEEVENQIKLEKSRILEKVLVQF